MRLEYPFNTALIERERFPFCDPYLSESGAASNRVALWKSRHRRAMTSRGTMSCPVVALKKN